MYENEGKVCSKCNEYKTYDLYYVHAGMSDGYLNKCKVCARADSLKNRQDNIERVRAYDRARGCRRTLKDLQDYRSKYPKKYKAHSIVNYAIKSEKLFREPCEVCGKEKVDAHHDDYAKPLNVRWLCSIHHHQWHAKHGEALNAI